MAHALQLAEQGAEIIDVGGESTHPGAAPVGEAEELRRVMPVIEQMAGLLKVPISIDTIKPGVAREALAAGASIVNDVAANREDRTLWEMVAEAGAGYVCMHTQGTPRTMQANPAYTDVVREVGEFFSERVRRLSGCGVGRDQIIQLSSLIPSHTRLASTPASGMAVRPSMALPITRNASCGKTPSSTHRAARITCGALMENGTSSTSSPARGFPRKTDASTFRKEASVASEMNSATRPSTRKKGSASLPAGRRRQSAICWRIR